MTLASSRTGLERLHAAMEARVAKGELPVGMAVVTEPDDVSAVPGRYGWEGGYGTIWFNDPSKDLVAIALTQTADFNWNGGAAEFSKLAYAR